MGCHTTILGKKGPLAKDLLGRKAKRKGAEKGKS